MNVAPEFITTFGSVACDPSTTPLPLLFMVSTVVASLIAAAADIVEAPVPVNCTAPVPVKYAAATVLYKFPPIFNVPLSGLFVTANVTVLYVADPGVRPVGTAPPNSMLPPL